MKFEQLYGEKEILKPEQKFPVMNCNCDMRFSKQFIVFVVAIAPSKQ